MARKTSDPVVLLRSIGRGKRRRGRSGSFAGLFQTVSRWLGGSSVAGLLGGSHRRGMVLPGWVAFALMLFCFGGGLLVGRHFLPAGGDSGSGLNAAITGRGPQAPGVLESETAPLTSEAFLVASYDGVPAGTAEVSAFELGRYLQGQGFETARPYRWSGADGSPATWCVLVYFDGATQRADLEQRLRDLPEEVPSQAFRSMRKMLGADWPQSGGI